MTIDEKLVFSIIQKAKETGKIAIGANQATKGVERGIAKLVVAATDVSPAEIIAHFDPLCKEMKVAYLNLGTKAELGSAAGISKGASTISVEDAGKANKELKTLIDQIEEINNPKKEEVKEEIKVEEVEEKVEEEVKEEIQEEEKVENTKEVKEEQEETKVEEEAQEE